MPGSAQKYSYISSVMHLNQCTGQWLISLLPLKMELLTVCFFYGKVSICANRELQELNAVVIGIKLYNFAIHETELLIERKQVLVRPYANITVYTGWVTLL